MPAQPDHTHPSRFPVRTRRSEDSYLQRVSTCLWFDDQALEAASFYVSLFPNSKILETSPYLEGSPSPRPAGSVLTVRFSLDGTEYVALNGGPVFSFSPAVSLVATCESQEAVDRLWAQLTDGGEPGRCGWLTDRFGVSWQIVPQALLKALNAPDRAAAQRAYTAMLAMAKIDIAEIERAYAGP